MPQVTRLCCINPLAEERTIRVSAICGSNSLPTTEKPGMMRVVLGSIRSMQLRSMTSGQRPGPSSRYTCSTRCQSSSSNRQAAYRARFPPLEWPPSSQRRPGFKCARAYCRAISWASVRQKLIMKSSFQPARLLSVPR